MVERDMYNELLALGESILASAKNFGADDVELYIQKFYTSEMRIITDYITSRTGIDVGVGIRVSVGKSVGFYSVSTLEKEAVLEGVKEAMKIAKNKPEDPNFKQLPDPIKGFGRRGIFDDTLANMGNDELVNVSGELLKKCYEYLPETKKIDYSFTRSVGAFAIVSTRDINVGDSGTVLVSYCEVQLPPSMDNAKGLSVIFSRKWSEGEFFEMSEKATKMAREAIGGKKIETPFQGQMLLANDVVSDYIHPLAYNISALNVQEGRSRFKDKLENKVAWDKLTILDDGQIEDGIGTSLSDGEGIPMKTKYVIDKGVLKGFLYDSYTAYRENKVSTGNGVRRGYSSTPSPSITNLVIEKEKNANLEDLITEIDKGVLIRGELLGAHLTDPIKGTFALTCLNALYIESGEVKYPLKAVTTSGNFFEMLNNVLRIGSDYFIDYTGKYPSIIVDRINLLL